MNRTNEALFNRPPRRTAYDVVVDSINRDKILYPETNDYVIEVPGGPYKSVRQVDVLQMRVPQSESLVHHVQHPAFINPSLKPEARRKAQGGIAKPYDEGSDTFCYREGFVIGKHNDWFRFSCPTGSHGTQVYSLHLPHTLTPIERFWLDNEGYLCVRTCGASRLVPNCSISIISTWSPPPRKSVNGAYVVHALLDNRTLLLKPEDTHFYGLTPDCAEAPEGCYGYLYSVPPANAMELAHYCSALMRAVCAVQCDIQYNCETGYFQIHKPDGSVEQRRFLLGDGSDILRCKLPSGPHSLEEVGGMLQHMLNPPEIIKGENDTLYFSDRWLPEQKVVLEAGFYLPQHLIAHLADLMSEKSDSTVFRGIYDPTQGKFALQSDGPLFSLHFQKCPALAYLLGFSPVYLSDRDCYESKHSVHFRYSPCGISSTNLYSVALDPARSQFTLHRNGSLECAIESVGSLGADAIVVTRGPQAFCAGDVVVMHNSVYEGSQTKQPSPALFDSGLYVVKKSVGWNRFILAMHVNTSTSHNAYEILPYKELHGKPNVQLYPCDGVVSASPRPFTLPMSLPEANLATVLGFERKDYIDPDFSYTSTVKCIPVGDLYLLLDIPELLAASEGTNPRITAQFGKGEPPRQFIGRLDKYLGGSAYDFTFFGAPQVDLFGGGLISVDKITVRLFKPNGKLYDTRRCDHSFVLRIVVEDS